MLFHLSSSLFFLAKIINLFINRDFRPTAEILKDTKEKTILKLNQKASELIRVGFYSEIINLDKFFFQCEETDQTNLKTTLLVSFQFHHTQMDGYHASLFLDELQKQIDLLKV